MYLGVCHSVFVIAYSIAKSDFFDVFRLIPDRVLTTLGRDDSEFK